MRKKDASDELYNLKLKIADEKGVLRYVGENHADYNGEVQTKVTGSWGGTIGGNMVKEIIETEIKNMSEIKNQS